eukprot:TRINITY_DN14930_c0_g1_i1.p1 TRINITY_DN14930_c0_g1~~TRINITY_DN14930_c0_g1_i1.p1  ORF type:complete len:319 (+),score=16.39 TRINITY_DN14930_c0_g1_i1:125-1081(+)
MLGLIGGGGAPLHSWHVEDARPSAQPSRRHLILPGKEDMRRSKSARGMRDTANVSTYTTTHRSRSARSTRSDSSSVYSSWTCPSSARSSSAAALPKAVVKTDRDKSKEASSRRAAHGAERAHGRWGAGQMAGAPSGHGMPLAFPRPVEKPLKAMIEREAALCDVKARGPAVREEKDNCKPEFSRHKVSRTVWKAPPGYSGFQPGVYAENVHGGTYHRDNKDALTRIRRYRDGRGPKNDPRGARWIQTAHGRQPARIGESGGHSTGCEIPGYGGFVPRSYAGNLVGVCVPRAAKIGWEPGEDGPNPPLIVHDSLGRAQA